MKHDLFLLAVRRTRWMALLVLLCCGGRTALAAGLPDGVVISPKHGLILTEKTFDGLPPWKWAVLSSDDRRQPGTRNDRVVYSSRNGDPNTDFMLFTPVCVSFKDFVQLSLSVRWIVEGTWQTPRGAVMPANGCSDPTIYLTRDQYVNLGGPSAFNAERTWYGYLIYPAVQAFVYVRTYPANPPGKWNLQKIAFHQSGENAVRDYDAEFHFDLAKFIEAIGQMAPGTPTMQAAYKYGFYSTEFYAAAGVDASLILIPIGRAGKAGRAIYGSLMAGTIGISAYNFTKAETDQEKLKAVLDIVMCLSFAHNALKMAKPKLGLLPPDGLPESAIFEDLIGSPSKGMGPLVRKTLGKVASNPSVTGPFPTPYDFMLKGVPEELKTYVQGSTRYKKLISIIEKNPHFFVWDDNLGPLVRAEVDGAGIIRVRSTTTWPIAYRDLCHEMLHTEVFRIPFFMNKLKFVASEGMTLEEFIDKNWRQLIDDEALAWCDSAALVEDLETHGASFVDAKGLDMAEDEREIMRLMTKYEPVEQGWRRVKAYVNLVLDYGSDAEDTLTSVYNRYARRPGELESLDGWSMLRRLGVPWP